MIVIAIAMNAQIFVFGAVVTGFGDPALIAALGFGNFVAMAAMRCVQPVSAVNAIVTATAIIVVTVETVIVKLVAKAA